MVMTLQDYRIIASNLQQVNRPPAFSGIVIVGPSAEWYNHHTI